MGTEAEKSDSFSVSFRVFRGQKLQPSATAGAAS
jgi:hypothetical protein